MYTHSKKRAVSILALAALFAALAGTSVFAQFADGYQINVVQQQVRTRMVNELRGSNHLFQFDNNAVVVPSGVRNQNRVTGSGQHRFNGSGWRVFNYEGQFNLSTGLVIRVDYAFSGGTFPPGSSDAGMKWSGRVDDVVRVRIVGRQAFANAVSGRPVSNIRYNFNYDLPRRNVNVTVNKNDGRGTVSVIQQPNALNGYSAVIEIRDTRGGSDQYSFDVFWDNFGGGRPPVGNGRMNWQGNVDDTVQITIRGRVATARAISGRFPTAVVANFQDNLPRRPVNVTVRSIEGRGDVRVIQQPSRENGFAAVIEIRDPRGGSDRYAFEASWDTVGGGGVGDDGAGMTWTGRVDGTARVTIRGRNASVREVQTGVRVDNVSYDFFDDLPRRAVNVRLKVLDGRGSVRLISEPDPGNNYSAVVEISDPQSGSDFYTFELEWNGGSGSLPAREGQMNWEGNVDATVQITIRGSTATARALSGRSPTAVRFNFREPLPRRAVNVIVRQIEGRGSVRVIQQPSRLNGYSSVIEIQDPRGGDDRYEFEAEWSAFGSQNNDGVPGANITWRGSVDALATISISDRNVVSQAMSGQPLRDVSYDIGVPLPRQAVTVRVRKREGRGSVRVLQQPNWFNDFTLILQINDGSSGRDTYEIELDW
ncbi:MAG TPA: hypothetical protein VMM38_10690 [Aridibacter sp.]|nr:hypothetical protein [Aridibacter sp.]